jgi:hypothetical protein
MRRTRLALWLALGLTSIVAMLLIAGSLAPLTAQPLTRFFEQITVDSTTGGKGFTASKITPTGQPQMQIAVCTLESAGVRYTLDGTTVTSTVGMPLAAGTSFQIIGHDALMMFRAIRATGSNGTLSCIYSTNQAPLVVAPLTPIGGGGSSSGGPVTQVTDPWNVAVTVGLPAGANTIGGVFGTLSNNAAVPGAGNNMGAMPCVVGVAAPTYTDGHLVFARCDAGGAPYVNVNNPSPTDANSYPFTVNGATATATGASTPCNVLSTASTNSISCKGSSGNLYGYELYNTTTTVYYLRLYNTASPPTCSSATGFIRSIPIPPAGTAGQVGGAVSNQVVPVAYATGIGYCITASSTSTANDNAAAGIFGEVRVK